MTNEDKEIIEKLVLGGVIGAAMGALATENSKGAIIGAIAGAAIVSSYHASQRAKESDLPRMLVENNQLFEVHKSGERIFIKDLPPYVKVPRKLILS
ncbi:MAG: hypothetical protein EAZ53_00010 [Bacteroidetes bacterium]|nr:MAG: hypothetical protein EAZ53_00010 [Bacteroidota bacterium]